MAGGTKGGQMDYIKNCEQGPNRKRIMVGITTRCSEDNLEWLKKFFTEKFQDLILDVEHLPITNTNRYEWEDNVNKYSAVILYHTQRQGRINITDVDGGIYDEELAYLCHKLGREKVLVVLDDMEDISEEQRQRILETQPSLTRLSSHLILIPETEKYEAASRKREEFLRVFGAEQTASCVIENISVQTSSRTGKIYHGFHKLGQRIIDFNKDSSHQYKGQVPFNPDDNNFCGKQRFDKQNSRSSLVKYKVGIFSRSGDDNYRWLVNFLQTSNTERSIDVCNVYINNYQSYYSEMSRCNFAILYHTKKQGRLNITDVTDSLYDQELRELSECLGKENVIVVVDDLMDANNEEKRRILKNQPSISALARDLFLFSEQHKDPETLLEVITLIQNDGRKNFIRVDINKEEKSQIWENEQHKDPETEQAKITLIKNSEQTTSSDDENIMDHTSSRPGVCTSENVRHNLGLFRSLLSRLQHKGHFSLNPGDIFGNRPLTSFVTTRPANKTSLVKYRVCIFSRSGEDNYQWLVRSLQTANMAWSIDVRCVYISNYYQMHYSEMSRCDFAILYHTKKQGRLNVTDSLYDQELRELSECLGKEKVIVVVDDLMDPSNEEKWRILENQPSITTLARDLFLFSEQHKDPETVQEITTLIERNIDVVDERWTDLSALQHNGAQEEVEQHQQPPQNTSNESILITNDDDISDIYTSRKRPNYNPCAYDHESSSSSKKNSFEEQSKKKLLEATNLSDDTTDTASGVDNQLRMLIDTGSAFFARLSEFNDSWRHFQRAVQNPQSEIQQLLCKTHTQAEELKEKDIVISNLRKEVYRLQGEIEDKQTTIEEKDKFIEELKENRDRLVDKTEEERSNRLEHPARKMEETIQEKEKAIMQLCVEIQNIRKKLQGLEKSEGLQGHLRKRRGAKKWTSEDINNEQKEGLDAHSTNEPGAMEMHSTLEDLWQRIAELESRIKHLEYTTDIQRHELDKYRQTVKEQSSQINEYEQIVDSLLTKIEDIRKN